MRPSGKANIMPILRKIQEIAPTKKAMVETIK